MRKTLGLSVPPTQEHAPSNSGQSFSSYSLDEFKALDADEKKVYTCYLTDLYNTDRNKLRHIVNKTGFLTLDCSTIESLELEGFNLTSLNLYGCQKLSSLKGLQHLTKLTSLYLSGCQNSPSL
jgi:Leucine-rich repeat (LRR) protein